MSVNFSKSPNPSKPQCLAAASISLILGPRGDDSPSPRPVRCRSSPAASNSCQKLTCTVPTWTGEWTWCEKMVARWHTLTARNIAGFILFVGWNMCKTDPNWKYNSATYNADFQSGWWTSKFTLWSKQQHVHSILKTPEGANCTWFGVQFNCCYENLHPPKENDETFANFTSLKFLLAKVPACIASIYFSNKYIIPLQQ